MDSDDEFEVSPSPSPLEQMQERHQAYLRWCAAMLEASVRNQEAVHERLRSARQQRQHALERLQVAKCIRIVTAKMIEKHKMQLDEVKARCDQIVRELHEENSWRPASVTMSPWHQQQLRERVATLKCLLEAKRRQVLRAPRS